MLSGNINMSEQRMRGPLMAAAVAVVGLTVAAGAVAAVARHRRRGNTADVLTLSTTPRKTIGRPRAPSLGLTQFLTSGMLPPNAASSSSSSTADNSAFVYEPIINVALWYDTRLPTQEALERVFTDHVVPHMRFHSTPIQEAFCGPVEWVCTRVEVAQHFYLRTAPMLASLEEEGFDATPEGAVRREVEELLNTTLTTKADGRPWWEVHVIQAPAENVMPTSVSMSPATEELRRPGMVVIRIHHALGDGVSLMEMFSDAVVDAAGVPVSHINLFSPTTRSHRRRPRRRSFLFLFLASLRYARSAIQSAVQIIGVATVGRDSPCAFQNESRQLPYQPNRFTVYFPSHSLSIVKKVKDALSAKTGKSVTVNDVELALFSGAVRRYLLRNGVDKEDELLTIHMSALHLVAMPMATPSEVRYQAQLRNIWALLYAPVALHQCTALERLLAVHRLFSALKQPQHAMVPVAFLVQRVLWKLPAALGTWLSVSALARNAFVFSNVPGPQCSELFFCGERVRTPHVLFPNLSNHVGILSAQGEVHMAMVLACSDVAVRARMRRELPEAFLAELRELADSAGVETRTCS
jgi:hypothetical protein